MGYSMKVNLSMFIVVHIVQRATLLIESFIQLTDLCGFLFSEILKISPNYNQNTIKIETGIRRSIRTRVICKETSKIDARKRKYPRLWTLKLVEDGPGCIYVGMLSKTSGKLDIFAEFLQNF